MIADELETELAYSSGHPDVDEAVRKTLATLPPITPTQRAKVNAIFDRHRP